jgi:hypothetical protein
MPTETTIANVALAHLNDGRITSLDEGTPLADALQDHWQLCRQSMLREFDWNFARHTQALSQLAGDPLAAVADPAYSYAYALPTDFLTARSATATDTTTPVLYDLRRDSLHTDSDTLQLTYTRDVPEASYWDPSFADAFAVSLAARAAKTVTGSDEKGAELHALLRSDFLAPARIASSTETRPPRHNRTFLPQSALDEARYY